MDDIKGSSRRQLSLSFVGRLVLLGVVSYSLIAAGISLVLLNRIETQANFTRDTQIPLILTQTRNAVKIERLSSLLRSIYLAKDRRLERQIQLQIQALTQGFSFDQNARLIEGSRQIADETKIIAKLRQQARDLREGETSSATAASDADDVDKLTTQSYDRAMHTIDAMAAQLSGDAAVVADDLASEIQRSAGHMQVGWILILLVPSLFATVLLIAARRHLTAPIVAAIDNLERIGKNERVVSLKRAPRIAELAMIDAAIVAYGQVSDDLHRTNAILHGLAEQDPLTGLANRRTFENHLTSALSRRATVSPDLSIIMVDVDHFKSVNDTFGHLVGDRALAAVADVLSSLPWHANSLVARYGGEEFVIVLEDCSQQQAVERAESLRRSIQELSIETHGGTSLRLTASFGLAVASHASDAPAEIVAAADGALYSAKRNGRNNVQVASRPGEMSKAS
ncbi:GGDEF domain-containing protein (plasmid) [Rhizobium sp. CB3171]|uniref:GGDEF domain-containing protein n=1 Tax=Rhizobium sp. CB3171 TaxID=3039157 RepID=UPI0024B0A73B|nr:GGDEF domain-containing protein [Rhizobium sp. CB3171]WFU05617.1 GGDEF domain-containing protein [Rhizobium sp. CB3171]